MRTGDFRITKKVNAQRIEDVPGLASVYPILRTPTVFVVNLDDPKYDIVDPKTQELYTFDYLIRGL